MTTERFTVTNISANGMKGLFKLDNDTLSIYDVARLINELLEENKQLEQSLTDMEKEYSEQEIQIDFLKDENKHMRDLVNENEQLKQRIKELEKEVISLSDGEADWLIEEEL